MNAPPGLDVDHKNGNTLDNRRSNLRIATRSQNNANQHKAKGGTSKYKGVSLCKETGKWRAFIGVEMKTVHIGRFESEKDAAIAYNKVAQEWFGEFAKLNAF